MTARPVPGTEGHRCWACGQTVTGAVCMGPHGDLRSRPEWPRQVCWVAATPLSAAPPEDVFDIPLERPAKRGAWPWRCPDCGEVFPSRLQLRVHVARNDLMDMGRASDAWIGEEAAS